MCLLCTVVVNHASAVTSPGKNMSAEVKSMSLLELQLGLQMSLECASSVVFSQLGIVFHSIGQE